MHTMNNNKERTTITLDAGILGRARIMGLNVSNLCEDALKEIIMSFEKNTLPKDCTHRWTFPFTTAFGLAKECIKCRAIQRVEVESYETTMRRANAM